MYVFKIIFTLILFFPIPICNAATTNFYELFSKAVVNIDLGSPYDTSEAVIIGENLLATEPNCNHMDLGLSEHKRCEKWFRESMNTMFIILKKVDKNASSNPKPSKSYGDVSMFIMDSVLFIRYPKIKEGDQKLIPKMIDETTEGLTLPLEAITFDLRGNPGGRVNISWLITKMFVAEGDIVTLDYADPNKPDRRYVTDLHHDWKEEIPIILITDGDTASSAEILVRALLIHDRVLFHIGKTTYGKNIFQLIHNDNSPYSYQYTGGKVLDANGVWHGSEGVIPSDNCYESSGSPILTLVCNYAEPSVSVEATK